MSDEEPEKGRIAQDCDRRASAELKALMQKFVEEIRVETRSAIYPVFRLPAGEQVRAVYRWVGRCTFFLPTIG